MARPQTAKKPATPRKANAVIRLDPELRQELEVYAAEFHLSLSGAVRSLLVRALRAERPATESKRK